MPDQPMEQRTVRAASNRNNPNNQGSGRSRQCYFTPVNCVLFAPMQNIQHQLVTGVSEIRPVLDSQAASRKRQTAARNSMFQRSKQYHGFGYKL
jgi:hypothetical protein